MDKTDDWQPETEADFALCTVHDQLSHLNAAVRRGEDWREVKAICQTIIKGTDVIGDGAGLSD